MFILEIGLEVETLVMEVDRPILASAEMLSRVVVGPSAGT
jgi:hypothetical protein